METLLGALLGERVARLKSLIEDEGLDLDTALARIADESRDPGLQETLARAALMRTIDRPAYESLLAVAGAPGFEAFVELPQVEPVPGRAGLYWLVPAARDTLALSWQGRPADGLQLHQAAAAFFAQPGHADPLAHLHHLAACDPKAALTLFEQEYDAADERFDLARCHALIEVLGGAQPVLGVELEPALAQSLAARRRRYLARSLFADAYYRTGQYFRRPRVHDAVAVALADPVRWVLHLHATGGMGKTMFLRQLIAREMVPAGVPCARIDFDEVGMDAVRARPWLLLLPICEQLNPQLPRPYLTELIESAPPFRRLLQPTAAADSAAAPVTEHDQDGGAGLLTRMGYALREAGAQRLLVVLDTLEVATIFPETVAQVFALLQQCHALVPGLRLILAGRYHLGTKVPAIAPVLAAEARTFLLDRFNPGEAAAYLRFRGLDDDALIEACVTKVREPARPGARPGCNPFKLALLADLVLGHDGADADFVRTLPNADYQYLLERVIKRIREQPLRWVVRYAAIPRRLTFEYMEQVLLPPLRRVLGGAAPDDAPQDPARLPTALPAGAVQDLWVPEAAADLGAEALWDALLRYESGQGWIAHVPGTGAYRGSLQLHGDVAGPMRELLSLQPIFGKLQEESIRYFEEALIRYFEALAAPAGLCSVLDYVAAHERRAQDWADRYCEVIFHRVQLDPPVGVASWRAALTLPMARQFPAVRLKLALELLRPEYAEDERIPLLRHGVPLVTTTDLAAAHLTAAESLEALLRGAPIPPDATWSAVRRHLELARVGAGPDADQGPHLALLEGALCANEGRYQDAIERLRRVLDEDQDPGRRFVATWHLAESLAAVGDRAALGRYEEAIALARTQLDRHAVALLQGRIARALGTANRPLEARDLLLGALRDTWKEPLPPALVGLLLQLAEAELALGDYGGTLCVLGRLEAVLEAVQPGAWDAADRAHSRFLAAAVWSAVTLVPQPLPESLTRAQRKARTPETTALLLHGRALLDAAQLRLEAAARHWDEATRIAEREGLARLQAEFTLQRVRLANRVGRYREALVLAEGGLRTAQGRGDAVIAACLELERAVAFAHAEDQEAARAAIEKALAPASPALPASLRGQALALGVALDLSAFGDVALVELETLIAAAQPTERHLILEPLAQAPGQLAAPAGWLERIDALLDAREGEAVGAFLAALGQPSEVPDLGALRRGLARVDLHRVFGDPAHAAALLAALPIEPPRVDGHPVEGSRVPQRLLVAEARTRIGARAAAPPLPPALLGEPPRSLVAAALLVEQAAALVAGGGADSAAASLLDLAAPLIEAQTTPTRWSARLDALRSRHGRPGTQDSAEADPRFRNSSAPKPAALDAVVPPRAGWRSAAVGLAMGTAISSLFLATLLWRHPASPPPWDGPVELMYFSDPQATALRVAAAIAVWGATVLGVLVLGRGIAALRIALRRWRLNRHFKRDFKPFARPQAEQDRGEQAQDRPQSGRTARMHERLLVPRWPEASARLGPEAGAQLARLEPPSGLTVAPALADDLLKDWRTLAERLGQVLLGDEERAAIDTAGAPLALRLKVPPGFLAALPWELVALPGEAPAGSGRLPRARALARVTQDEVGSDLHSVRFAQSELIRTGTAGLTADGFLGPQTRAAIAAFQGRHALPASGRIDALLIGLLAKQRDPAQRHGRVLVAQPGRSASADEEAGYASRGQRRDVADHYGGGGAEVRTLEITDAAQLAEALKRYRPTLLHLVATVRESQGMAVLDFVRRRQSSTGAQFTASLLDSLMKGSDGPRPFLVLDIARPSSSFEAALALGLRNGFADDLLRLRTFTGVLASGLEQPALLGLLARTLGDTLAQDPTMGALAMGVRALFASEAARQATGNELDLALAYLGTALFAENPDLPCTIG